MNNAASEYHLKPNEDFTAPAFRKEDLYPENADLSLASTLPTVKSDLMGRSFFVLTCYAILQYR
jgi:hypothetical protein